MVVTGGPDGAIPQSPAVRRRNGFAEACSVRCGAGASPAGDTLRSCGQTLSVPPWRPLRSRSPRVGRPCPHRCDARRSSPGPRLVGQFATRLENTLADRVSTVAAAETLAGHVRSRPAASLERAGITTSTLGRQAVGDPDLVRHLRPGRSPKLATTCRVPVFIEACSRAHVAPVPSRGNAPRNFSPNRTEADR